MNNFYQNRFRRLYVECKKIPIKDIEYLKNLIVNTHSLDGKIIICGNGGSSATASHVSVDLNINCKVKTINFNEYNLITCFSNDFGYENWIKKSLEIHAEPEDLLILISCSGNSKNLVMANEYAKKIGMKVATLTGCKKNNILNSNSYNHRIWVSSKDYNIIESVHHSILLTIIDKIKLNIKKTYF